MKIQLILSYDGSKFQGSQTQPHKNSVEDVLKQALSHVGIFSKIVSSSRTDKGVHANNQSVCVECGEHFNDFNRLKQLINRHAHPFIHIKSIKKVDDSFQARYDAKARKYRYIISHDEFDVFRSNYCLFLPKIDTKKANELLKLFIGEHDFSLFMKVGSDTKSPIRTVYKAFCYSHKNKTIIVFKANGFLRAQVRLMVSAVLKGLKYDNGKNLIQDQLQNKKIFTRMPVSPNGLYLNKVFYQPNLS
ncbi:tRNA pseudouridine(38-40) synthase TruA [Campylobacter pinnipediorum]|uniref:tRNA pseudouridine(38-40) synthase TruA n=1 Tax=Campylobacter pinnipediorum TaxID=1965231 RepID=UPI00084DFFC4|nr:tRNA pseudouridine(38-40) synthase TruA [Campylobacter pinnipediorum]